MKFTETRRRSITKTVTFRLLVIVSDLILIFALTRRLFDTITITVLTNLASTIFYFLHERIWNGIAWDKR